MTRIFTICSLLLFTTQLLGQELVSRMPLYEVFTSSTCPPCKPANEYLVPIFQDYEDDIAVIMYHMNWPGNGDPYFTSEAGSRRSFYSVNGIPAVFRNSSETAYNTITASAIESDTSEQVAMKMELRYMIDEEEQTIRVRGYAEALDDYTDGGQRLMIPILEKLTTNNKESNGETEFHWVFKKMLPAAQGEIIIGDIEAGDFLEYDTTYAFQGDYRLPFTSQDQIDHEIEHSVEEFDDLEAIMFMQSLSDKEVYQAAKGVREYSEANMDRPWGADRVWPTSISEFNDAQFVSVFPNPTEGMLTVHFAREQVVHSLTLQSLTGATVFSETKDTYLFKQLDLGYLKPGVYILSMVTDKGAHSRRVVVQ